MAVKAMFRAGLVKRTAGENYTHWSCIVHHRAVAGRRNDAGWFDLIYCGRTHAKVPVRAEGSGRFRGVRIGETQLTGASLSPVFNSQPFHPPKMLHIAGH